jgi:hypothetical protein
MVDEVDVTWLFGLEISEDVMTDAIEWGSPIKVDGKRPEWLLNGQEYKIEPVFHSIFRNAESSYWHGVKRIKLPATHFASIVQAYNDKHGTSFLPWAGGDSAPRDWDGGQVLYRSGHKSSPLMLRYHKYEWSEDGNSTIVGYTRRQPAASDPDTVTIKRMSAKDAALMWRAWDTASGTWRRGWLQAFKELGVINEIHSGLTARHGPANAMAAATGLSLSDAEKALEWIKSNG